VLALHAFIVIQSAISISHLFIHLMEFIMSSYEGRMGASVQGPQPNPPRRQDSVQHAVQVADLNELRRAFLLYGTSGQASRMGSKPQAR
jgi:hypothetical protein